MSLKCDVSHVTVRICVEATGLLHGLLLLHVHVLINMYMYMYMYQVYQCNILTITPGLTEFLSHNPTVPN